MRNEAINGYILHHKPYQEKRAIYYIFSQEYGLIHGIGKKGLPLFVPLTLFASGKKSLKTLQQINIAQLTPPLFGSNQYAGLYVNEITLHLLAVEDIQPQLYCAYQHVLALLRTPLNSFSLRLALRQYEWCLFSELGFAIDFVQDAQDVSICENRRYTFEPESGFIGIAETEKSLAQKPLIKRSQVPMQIVEGSDIIKIQQAINNSIRGDVDASIIDDGALASWGIVHRQMIDHLFDYKPLQSRILWQQLSRYQI
ncbi:DNA repair protein RecO [Psychrobacter sp. I-STPA6b]|uniref:DNA repair protein RecO n=1 Tax=Psychrobacter sp. I-STPA6b TaxID=2585718 RepID=UPI001D0C64E1|nr:DNA repair protein RecO C-terminal domain-containing protein [Psychrobacter sp. I-STPA6b]